MSQLLVHTVFFSLNDNKNSDGEAYFFEAAKKLSEIPGVFDFKCVKQISAKNNFDYGLTMSFENDEAYQGYTDHPDHVDFVEKIWKKHVREFLEIDYRDL